MEKLSTEKGAGATARKIDYYSDTQLTFDKTYYAQQHTMRDYQKKLDKRLARPKSAKVRVVNQTLKSCIGR